METDKITMAHGAGGRAYRELVERIFLPLFAIAPMHDSALRPGGGRLALTTDSYVVSPLFFPGGDIGRLAVCGTVNDLAVSGAVPKYLTVGMILEDGLPVETLRRVAASMAAAAAEAGVELVTGDTKVVEKGRCDGLYLNTAGVGFLPERFRAPAQRPAPGDALLTTGCLGTHGAAILAARLEVDCQPPLQSDVRPLNGALQALLRSGAWVNAMRDPTRGGAAGTLTEWAGTDLDIEVDETAVPLLPEVAAVCSMLGLDPLYTANEGVALISLPEREAARALAALAERPDCRPAVIGRVKEGTGRVHAITRYGTYRRLLPPSGAQLPRIC